MEEVLLLGHMAGPNWVLGWSKDQVQRSTEENGASADVAKPEWPRAIIWCGAASEQHGVRIKDDACRFLIGRWGARVQHAGDKRTCVRS